LVGFPDLNPDFRGTAIRLDGRQVERFNRRRAIDV
jgi:hypothetical protein